MTGAPAQLELCDPVGGVSLDALAGAPDALLDDLLASRWWDPDRPQLSYDRLGRELSLTIRAALPQDWSRRGKLVLDFGCGAGRVLRHFLAEAEQAELWGCDIDGPSIAWLKSALCPPCTRFTPASGRHCRLRTAPSTSSMLCRSIHT